MVSTYSHTHYLHIPLPRSARLRPPLRGLRRSLAPLPNQATVSLSLAPLPNQVEVLPLQLALHLHCPCPRQQRHRPAQAALVCPSRRLHPRQLRRAQHQQPHQRRQPHPPPPSRLAHPVVQPRPLWQRKHLPKQPAGFPLGLQRARRPSYPLSLQSRSLLHLPQQAPD